MTFKERKLWCDKCKIHAKKLLWDTDPVPVSGDCGGEMEGFYGQDRKGPAVIGDEMDLMVPHGVCYPDGTPRRFTSKSDLRQALKAARIMKLLSKTRGTAVSTNVRLVLDRMLP